MEKESVLPGLVLPMVSNIHDMTGCIRQALALFDRGTAFPLRLVSVDIVRAFHFHLHCIMSRTVSSPKWHTESQVWNAAGKNGLRLDVFISNKGVRFGKRLGFQLLATENIMDLQDYLANQATLYKEAVYSREMLIIIVLSEWPQSRDNLLFTINDSGISIIYVYCFCLDRYNNNQPAFFVSVEAEHIIESCIQFLPRQIQKVYFQSFKLMI